MAIALSAVENATNVLAKIACPFIIAPAMEKELSIVTANVANAHTPKRTKSKWRNVLFTDYSNTLKGNATNVAPSNPRMLDFTKI